MPAEHFRSHETQPATSQSIQSLFSHLEHLVEKIPNSADIDQTAKIYSAEVGQKSREAEMRTGIRSTLYSLKGNGQRPSQYMHIRLKPEENQGYLSILQLEQDIDGKNKPVVSRYYIHSDKVFKHRILDEDFSNGAEEQMKKEKEAEENGFALMTESEVRDLNKQLDALIKEQ